MKPSRMPAPLLRSAPLRACTLNVSWAELGRCLGTPAEHDAGEGLGFRYRWTHTCDCGLELVVELPQPSAQAPQEALVWMTHLEVEHMLAHLGLSHDRVLWRADLLEPLSLEGWAVIRRGAHGHRFDLCVLSVREHAECMARLVEARSPHHDYDVELRGTQPRHEAITLRLDRPGPRFVAEAGCFVGG